MRSASKALLSANGLQIKTTHLQIIPPVQPTPCYLSSMTKTQRYISWAVVVFMMVWGLDLINVVKFRLSISWAEAFYPLRFSQAAYCLLMICLTREFLRRIIPQRKFLLLLPAVLLLVAIFIVFRYAVEEILFPILFNLNNYNRSTTAEYYILDNIYYSLVYIMLGALLYLLDAYVLQQKDQAELVKRNREAELQFLRSQINPHFLFNTLNNIYSLVHEKSDQAPGAILQLSELMRYLLYEKNEKVPVKKEWDYIHHFIALQQLRFEKPVEVHQKTEGNWEQWQIAPYLFIPLFENAFKHGDFRKDPLEMNLSGSERELKLLVRNAISTREKDKTGGIGLENVRKRLELIYPGRNSMFCSEKDNKFEVTITISSNKTGSTARDLHYS